MALTRTPRSRWIDAGLRALADGGPQAVRIETLAAALGVSKGGFYWHFEDRRALLQEMLDTWERATTEEAIERLDAGGGDVRERLGRLVELTSPGVVRTDLAVREWSRRDAHVAERLRRVDHRRLAYLRSLFAELGGDADDVEARALLAYALLIGNHFIAADHDDRTRAEVIALTLDRLAAA